MWCWSYRSWADILIPALPEVILQGAPYEETLWMAVNAIRFSLGLLQQHHL